MSSDEEKDVELEEIQETKTINLQLGDVIKIIDPTNEVLNEQTFLIDYIDDKRMTLINTQDLNMIQLTIEDGVIQPGSIVNIELIFRNELEGYARQNNLLPGKWVNIYFGGDVPVVMTGEITNLEEDMIEITSYPDKDVLYINFGYKGIPEDLPIDSIELRNAPEKLVENDDKKVDDEKEETKDDAYEPGTDDFEVQMEEESEKDEEIVLIPKKKIKEEITSLILRADEVHFGKKMGKVTQEKEVDESQKRYNIEAQSNDLLDDLLSQVPNSQRTTAVLNNIHTMINRFQQLRTSYSVFDEYNNIVAAKEKGSEWKPLVEQLQHFKQSLYWILPVVKNIKKMYDVNMNDAQEYNDIITLSFDDSLVDIETAIENYKSNISSGEENKYYKLYAELNPYFTPFTDINPESVQQIIHSLNATTELNTIVDTLGDLYSTVVEKDNVKRRRYVMQRYNTSLQRLETTELTGSKMVTRPVKLTHPDRLEIASIMTLPEPTVRFSNINLPGTNVLTKSNLHMHFLDYWQMLKQKTNIESVFIDDLTKKNDYDEESFINNIKNYILSAMPSLGDEEDMDIQTKYVKYATAIIPKTRILFNIIKKYIKSGLSLVSITQYLQPFMIYTDDLTYMQYNDMNEFIVEEISKYNKRYIQRKSLFSSIGNRIGQMTQTTLNFNELRTLLERQPGIEEIVFDDTYAIAKETSDSEALKQITVDDLGYVFNYAVAMKNIDLMVPDSISELLKAQEVSVDKKINKERINNNCVQYTIAKEYNSEEQMKSDNGKPIYYDRKYDTTNYSIFEDKNANIEKDVSKAEQTLNPEKYREFLINRVETKNNYDHKDAVELVDAILEGYKLVREGDIAILYNEKDENDEFTYYKRKSNRWELDNSIPKDLITNSQDLLCNFQKGCVDVEKRYSAVCETYGLNKNELTKTALNDILKNFDRDYEKSKAELQEYVNKQFDYYVAVYEKVQHIRKLNNYKYNRQQFNIGFSFEEKDGETEAKISPFLKLQNLILGQSDFVKKQNDIVRFAVRFTREANEDGIEPENKYYRYCLETNTPILPLFIYQLAQCFVETPDLYLKKVDEIINASGKESDDGDAWVDEHTGEVICRRDFDTEEGYEQGYKMRSREIMEADAADGMFDASKSTKESVKYETVESKMANKVINSVANFMGIDIDSRREFILKIINDTLPIAMPKEQDYVEKVKARAKAGKSMPKYVVIFNSTIMYLTLGALLIGIQTSIPSIKTRKTFPGCVRSFVGYPFDGDGDMSSLNYIACIAYKVKTDSDPWSGLMREKEANIAKQIKAFIDTYYFRNAEVMRMFKEKTAYLLENPKQEIPPELDVTNWIGFLPPLVDFKITQLSNVSSEYKSRLLSHIRSGSGLQLDNLLVIQSKAMSFSLAIQEKIQNIISKKKLIMSNAVNEPFLENACCNELSAREPVIEYFNKDDSDILRYNEVVQDLTNILYDVHALTLAPFLFSNENTKNIYPVLSTDFTENTIYSAFIHYCKFNTDAVVPDDLLPLCGEKPGFIRRNDMIQEKIRKLKQDGRVYTNDSLLRLLQIISRRNIIHLTLDDRNMSPVSKLQDIVDHIDKENDENVPTSLVQNIRDLIDTYDVAVSEDTAEMRKLKNYLAKTNESMKDDFFMFINTYGNIPKREKSKMKRILESFTQWEMLEEEQNSVFTIADDALYNSIQFIRIYIHDMIKVFPNIILNKVDYSNIKIPTYLGFAKKHTNDLKSYVDKYYKGLSKFYASKTIEPILMEIQKICINLLRLMDETPCLSDIHYKESTTKSIFDRRTSLLLFENYLLQCFTNFIKLSDNDEMIMAARTVSLEEMEVDTVENTEDREMRLGFIGFEKRLQEGDLKELKKTTADLLITYLTIFNAHKHIVDIPYAKVQDVIFKSKESEKDTFTDRLQAMNDEAREIDTILKINKLAHWGKGADVSKYSKDTFDEDRILREKMQGIENTVRTNKQVVDGNVEQYMEDYVEDRDRADEIDRDAYDMSHITEDYMDGDPDGDEVEEWGEYN